jgi:hypothetical protein
MLANSMLTLSPATRAKGGPITNLQNDQKVCGLRV